jgi:hypothetical protein
MAELFKKTCTFVGVNDDGPCGAEAEWARPDERLCHEHYNLGEPDEQIGFVQLSDFEAIAKHVIEDVASFVESGPTRGIGRHQIAERVREHYSAVLAPHVEPLQGVEKCAWCGGTSFLETSPPKCETCGAVARNGVR